MIRKTIAAAVSGTLLMTAPAMPEGLNEGDFDPAAWLSRTDVSVSMNDDRGVISIETLQPILSLQDAVVFMQGRVAGGWNDWDFNDSNFTLNVGAGYRRLVDESTLVGFSAFYDHSTEFHHQRLGLGGEVFTQNLTARLNAYIALTDWKTVTNTATLLTEERAMSGVDGELETRVPYMPWLRASAGMYYWNAKTDDDVVGFRGALRGDLTDYVEAEVGAAIDNYDERIWGKLSLSLGGKREAEFTALNDFISDEVTTQRDLSLLMLSKVKRNNQIVTERRTTNKATGVRTSGIFISGV